MSQWSRAPWCGAVRVMSMAWSGAGRVGIQGGYTGEYPPSTLKSPPPGLTSEAGPGSPRGAGVGGLVRAGGGRALYPPCGPGRSWTRPGPPWYRTLANAASGPIRARIRVIYSKVSQNHEVSPENVQKAYHSPYFQNGRQKSPLDILRFLFLAAFSHKELMASF